MLASIGNANAAVLPVPVCACPSKSLPLRMCGILAAWIGDGFSYPTFSNACKMGSGKPKSLKVNSTVSVMWDPNWKQTLRYYKTDLLYERGNYTL